MLVVAAIVIAGACSGGDEGDPPLGPTVPLGGTSTTSTTVAPTTTTLGPADYDVPEVIDQAYVQRVVSAYDKVLGDAIRVLKRDGGVSEEFLKHLLAIYTEEEFEFQQKAWLESVGAGRVEQTSASAGDPVTTVVGLTEASAGCVIARVEQDDSANFLGESVESPQDDYVVLVRKKEGRDPLDVNSTPWVMSFDGFKDDNSVPRNSCDD